MKYPALMHNLAKVSYTPSFFSIHLRSFSLTITLFPPGFDYRPVYNSTDVLSATWPSRSRAPSSRSPNWRRLAGRKASWRHWAMGKSLMGSFLESLCHIEDLSDITVVMCYSQLVWGFADVPQSLSSPHTPAGFTVFVNTHKMIFLMLLLQNDPFFHPSVLFIKYSDFRLKLTVMQHVDVCMKGLFIVYGFNLH